MAFTRFHDDPCRIKKQLQETTGAGRYMLNKPGWGESPCFMDDPHIRMEQWGANLQTNTINLESDLLGLTRPLTKDCESNNFKTAEVKTTPIQYPKCDPFTEQSRVTNPAWWYRDLEQNHNYILPLDPQENTCIPFQNNLSSRILEKDNFVAKIPCIGGQSNSNVLASNAFMGYGSGSNVNNCSTTRTCGTAS
jgi:hypothetical protein